MHDTAILWSYKSEGASGLLTYIADLQYTVSLFLTAERVDSLWHPLSGY